MERNPSLSDLPNEILLEILDHLDRFQLVNIVRLNHRIRPLAQYTLEHRKKIRLCGDVLRVLVLSPPSKHDLVGEASRAHFLTLNIINEVPTKKTRHWKQVEDRSIKVQKQVRGTDKRVVMIEAPNAVQYRKKLYIDAVAADLCLLIVDPREIDEFTEYIKEAVFGCCFMMSARNVIVAIDLVGNQDQNAFNETRTKISKLLDRTVGMCYKIVPIDISTGSNIFPSVSVPIFKWWSGPSLNELLIADQLRTNFDEPSYKKLCEEPFRFQMMIKHKIGGIGTVLEGRVISGMLKADETVLIQPGKITTIVKFIEAFHEGKEEAKPGDIVGINIRNVSVRDLYNRFTTMTRLKETDTVNVNCTMAFRAQIVVMKSDRFTQHQMYNVFYGAARIRCVLWWIFPTDGKNHDRAERKLKLELNLPPKPEANTAPPSSEYYKQLKEYNARVEKEKEVQAKLQAESGVNYVRPPRQTFKKATAILVPLIHYDIETYKPSAFEKNYRGKVMITEYSSIVGVGRVDRVISVAAPTFNPYIPIVNLRQYETVVDQAASLFNLPTEQKQLELFLDHVTTNEHAKKSIKSFNKS